MTPEMIAHIKTMRHSPAHNYVIPGLTSWLIGTPNREHGCIRLFTMSRYHEEAIIPHSHRFDFRCLVLAGRVRNVVWSRTVQPEPGQSDEYAVSEVTFEGELGKHKSSVVEHAQFVHVVTAYGAGAEYAMRAEQFHSIFFDKGSEVLFFEGPNRLETSQVLEPVVGGLRIPLFKTEDWMFKRGE